MGRSYRVIDRLDVVPALPPFEGYVHLDYSLWIQARFCQLSDILVDIACHALPHAAEAAPCYGRRELVILTHRSRLALPNCSRWGCSQEHAAALLRPARYEDAEIATHASPLCHL